MADQPQAADETPSKYGRKACAGLRQELIDCLLASDCVQKANLSAIRKGRKKCKATWMDKRGEKKKKKTPTQCSNDNCVAAPKSNFTGSNSTEKGIDDAIKSNRMLMADLQWIKAKGKAIKSRFWPSLLANFAFWTTTANGRGWPTLASCWILEIACMILTDRRKEDGRASLALAWPRHGVAETQQSVYPLVWSWIESIAAFASPANGGHGDELQSCILYSIPFLLAMELDRLDCSLCVSCKRQSCAKWCRACFATSNCTVAMCSITTIASNVDLRKVMSGHWAPLPRA
ncbi:uncharacterized protein TRIADDRAFT_60994 [Trichoplax adhaerens]|uniref:Cytochrome c oxidase assembly factor 5 n=1 Tax=Trichoplax adhaerens TaxID=10228 RepID=B3S9Q8_TRIAD|nr:predicted protein [Trichoplax adhaerens]EDV20578.1 predicted protein [Trichoplax adhaerens]|eukprot:XP_002117004.1 predicted protein [Trichoplax adhaerens]